MIKTLLLLLAIISIVELEVVAWFPSTNIVFFKNGKVMKVEEPNKGTVFVTTKGVFIVDTPEEAYELYEGSK